MAELLLRMVDKTNADPTLDLMCIKRGDVVVICDDGWKWTPAEQCSPETVIIKMPSVSVAELADMTATQNDSYNVSVRRRAKGFNLSMPPVDQFFANIDPANRVVLLSRPQDCVLLLAARFTKPSAQPIVTLR